MPGRLVALFVALLVLDPLSSVVAQGFTDVDEAVSALRNAFSKGDERDRIDAIEASVNLRDARVVRAIRRGVDSRQPLAVRQSAVDTLGRLGHPEALKALHSLYRSDRKLSENEELFGLLLTSIGRHGDRSSIQYLKDNPFRNLTVTSGTARIMGLGNIRHRDAIEALVMMSRKAGGRRVGVAPSMHGKFRRAFRVAMNVLTGVDQGLVPADWDRWWRDNRSGFRMPEGRPHVGANIRAYWQSYWDESYGPEPMTDHLEETPFEIVTEPSKERVAQARKELKEAWASKAPDSIVYTLERHGAVGDKSVIRDVARGFRVRDPRVRMTTSRVLGWNPSRKALKQLHREFRRRRDWDNREDEFAVLLRAIGRHEDPASIQVLITHPFRNLTIATGRARVLGLGRIRKKDSVETLIKAMSLANNSRSRAFKATDEPRFMDVARIALISLTGVDHGESKDAWRKWWRENKRDWKISPTRQPLPPLLKKKWEEFWKERYDEGGVTR